MAVTYITSTRGADGWTLVAVAALLLILLILCAYRWYWWRQTPPLPPPLARPPPTSLYAVAPHRQTERRRGRSRRRRSRSRSRSGSRDRSRSHDRPGRHPEACQGHGYPVEGPRGPPGPGWIGGFGPPTCAGDEGCRDLRGWYYVNYINWEVFQHLGQCWEFVARIVLPRQILGDHDTEDLWTFERLAIQVQLYDTAHASLTEPNVPRPKTDNLHFIGTANILVQGIHERVDGEELTLVQKGTGTVTLVANSPLVHSSHRLLLSSNIVMAQYAVVKLMYIHFPRGWILVSSTA